MRSTLVHAVFGAVLSALAPVVALLLLDPDAYGRFSVVFLIGALGISMQFSLISEAWMRDGGLGQPSGGDEPLYISALTGCALLFGVVGAIAGWIVIGDRPLYILAAFVATGFTTFRMGARYLRVARGRYSRAVLGDLLGAAVFIIAVLAWWGDPFGVWAAWALSSLVSGLILALPRYRPGAGLTSWIRAKRRHVGVLLADSSLLDLGSIGVPIVLAGFIPPAQFGVYRAVSSAAMPVGLVLEPLRPALAHMSAKGLFTRRVLGVLGAGAVLSAVAVWAVLELVLPATGLEIGTLSALRPYALPTALFVAAFLVSQVSYIVARGNTDLRGMMAGRIAQTIGAVLFPVIGLWLGGLTGAIWGFLASAVWPAIIWMVICWRDLQAARSAAE